MQTSVFLARLLGPTLFIMGVSLVVHRKTYPAMVSEFMAGHALLYLAGILALVPGIALVLVHNVWAADWRIIITLLGWLAIASGLLRLLFPERVKRIGRAMSASETPIAISGAVLVLLGAILAYAGYSH